ncbi:TIGR00341 family protein, partial [Halobium palmae]
MRLIQTVVSDRAKPGVEERLGEFGAEYVFVDATGSLNEELLLVPVPGGAEEPVLDELREAGLDDDSFTVTTEARSAGESSIEALSERFVEGPKGEEGVSHARLRERALDL